MSDLAAMARQLEEARLVAAIEEKLARKRLLEEQLAWEAERDAEREQIASQLERLEAIRSKLDQEIEERTAAAEESLQRRTTEFVAYRDQALAQLKAAEDALRLAQTQLALERRALEVDKSAIVRDRLKLENDQNDFRRERQEWLDAVSRRIPAMVPRGPTPDIFALAEWNDSAAGAIKGSKGYVGTGSGAVDGV
jgi:seryl-tRNA synthetase